MVVHAPVTRHGGALRFHVARANRAAPHLDGATVLLSLVGPEGYVTPNWYPEPQDQVPTWNYVAVEIEGRAAAVDDDRLIEQLDALAATHEPRLDPAEPWTRAKMTPERFAAMLAGIRGFELDVTAARGTAKLSQNKPLAVRAGVAAGLRASGHPTLADAVDAQHWPHA